MTQGACRRYRSCRPRVFLLLALWTALRLAAPSSLHAGATAVKIASIDVGMSEAGPVVLLKALGRAVPVFVDPVVAESIRAALGGEPPPRPLTHDLMRTVLESLAAKVTGVTITLKGEVFYADLTLSVDGKEKVFDSRASDAIALALRFGAPIFVGDDLLRSVGKPIPGSGEQAL